MRVMPTRRRPARGTRTGAAAAELAVLLPVLGLIFFGCIDFGRFAYSYIALTNAARAGAGLGCVNPVTTSTYRNWQTKVKEDVATEMSGLPGFDASKLKVDVKPVPTTNPERVEVKAIYPFKTLMSWPGISQEINMSRTVVLRMIR
jgi:Flp pilus assembly protein TadG